MSLVILCPEHGPIWDTNQFIGDCVDVSKWVPLKGIAPPEPWSPADWVCPVSGCRRTIRYEERATFEMAILRAIQHGFKIKVRELRKPSRA